MAVAKAEEKIDIEKLKAQLNRWYTSDVGLTDDVFKKIVRLISEGKSVKEICRETGLTNWVVGAVAYMMKGILYRDAILKRIGLELEEEKVVPSIGKVAKGWVKEMETKLEVASREYATLPSTILEDAILIGNHVSTYLEDMIQEKVPMSNFLILPPEDMVWIRHSIAYLIAIAGSISGDSKIGNDMTNLWGLCIEVMGLIRSYGIEDPLRFSAAIRELANAIAFASASKAVELVSRIYLVHRGRSELYKMLDMPNMKRFLSVSKCVIIPVDCETPVGRHVARGIGVRPDEVPCIVYMGERGYRKIPLARVTADDLRHLYEFLCIEILGRVPAAEAKKRRERAGTGSGAQAQRQRAG